MVVFLYITFALISTIVNILFQYISFILYNGFAALYIAMIIGTITGLITKYILDKKYVFSYETKTKKEDTKKFFLYSLMGIFTTIIFWSFEIVFNNIFEYENAKYIGGFIGLTIGYTMKYFLDKKFVFKKVD